MTKEYNFDGLVGPTHNYAGLAYGNVASMRHAQEISNPKQAAKEGLEKMRTVMQLGVPQAVLPPHQRPNELLLRELGFKSYEEAFKFNPAILSALFSASSMWAANAATISPSSNTKDQRIHITPANLTYNLHRAQEASFNYKLFNKIFSDPDRFRVHMPLPSYNDISDEGAANHNIFCKDYDSAGLEMYVYGRTQENKKFTGRQTRLASHALALTHDLSDKHLLIQQNPAVIDQGVFHNDVICVVNKNVMFYHEEAFLEQDNLEKQIRDFFADECHLIKITNEQLSVEDAVATYLFNSQLLTLPDDSMALILPEECQTARIVPIVEQLLSGNNPINHVEYVSCRQSMQNGGGPACLRLRLVMNEEEQRRVIDVIRTLF